MSLFILRVQLSVETQTNYTNLKNRLIKIGYSKAITNDKGTKYRLPNGNYAVETNEELQSVLDKTQRVVTSFDRNAQFLLVESKGTGWYNLPLYGG